MVTLRRISTPVFAVKETYKKVNRHNPLSNKQWTEETDFLYYEVDGKKFIPRYGRKLQAARKAVKYCRELNDYYKSFPRHILETQKGFDNAIKWGLDLSGWYCEISS